MKRSIMEEAIGKLHLASLTVEQYEEMIAQSILPEGAPIELLDGLLVQKDRSASGKDLMTVGAAHQLVMNKLARLAERFARYGCFLALQGPIRISPNQEPEPDASVVAGLPEDYAKRHPGAGQVFCVIEVADNSLERDRTTKQRIYAAAGIPQYVIVNLVDGCVELRYNPDVKSGAYRKSHILPPGKSIKLLVGPGQYLSPIPVADMLP